MRIDQDLKLDYKDVLIRPKRSTLKSRREVTLKRGFTFRNYQPDFPDNIKHEHYRGVPIMASLSAIANVPTPSILLAILGTPR